MLKECFLLERHLSLFSIITLLTDIWFVVSVPVLSEQMTEVHPKVSTDGRLLTIAFFLAILLVPRNNTRVKIKVAMDYYGVTVIHIYGFRWEPCALIFT